MRYEIYHTTTSRNLIPIYNDVPTASVEADNLNEVFKLTNHHHSDWTENDGVTSYTDSPRSTSVGDMIIDENGKRVVVDSFGFTQVAEYRARIVRETKIPETESRLAKLMTLWANEVPSRFESDSVSRAFNEMIENRNE